MAIDSFGDGYMEGPYATYWLRSYKYHRYDGPAIIEKSGWVRWYQFGVQHRDDGPAVISPDGRTYWYLDGEHITSPQQYQQRVGLSTDDMTRLILTHGPFC